MVPHAGLFPLDSGDIKPRGKDVCAWFRGADHEVALLPKALGPRTMDYGRTTDQGRTKNQAPGTKDQASDVTAFRAIIPVDYCPEVLP